MTSHKISGALRILNVAPALYPGRGGSAVAALGMCRALRGMGQTVDLVATNLGEPGNWSLLRSTTKLDIQLGIPVDWQGVACRFFDVVRPSRFAVARGLHAWLSASVSTYDVVHIHELHHYPGMMAAHVASRQGVPYVISPHGELAPYHRRRRRLRKLIFHRVLESRTIDHAAAIHYTSHREFDSAKLVPVRAPGIIVPLGVDMDLAAVGALRGQFRLRHPEVGAGLIVTFLGRLAHQKGLDLLIPAFARLSSDFPESHLVIAGPIDDDYGRRMRDWADKWHMGGRVTFTGFVDGLDKAMLLSDTDIWVLPSRDENFGIAVVEAMACGVAVIVSRNVGIHTDIAAAGAGLVVDCDIGEISAALATLMSDPELRRDFGINGSALVRRRFTWESTARELTTAYERICRETSTRSAKPN